MRSVRKTIVSALLIVACMVAPRLFSFGIDLFPFYAGCVILITVNLRYWQLKSLRIIF